MSLFSSTIYVVVAISLAGSEHVSPEQKANYEANVAYYSKKYDVAVDEYKRALSYAEQAADGQYAAIAMFGLARSYAQLCQIANAETWFRKSIVAREALQDIRHAHLTQNLLEYARFLASLARYTEAVTLYDRGVPMLASLDVETEDPLGYAFVLDEYEILLKHTGRANDASHAAAKAKMLRETYVDKKAKFKPEPYANCTAALAPT